MTSKNESVYTMQPLSHEDGIKKTTSADTRSSDVEPGQIIRTDERGSLHQSFSARKLQVCRQHTDYIPCLTGILTSPSQVIALGSNIGSGLFIGTGKALAYGGPGNMLIAYLIVCFGVWANVQSLIEMTILYPTSGNFVDYAGRWVDPAVAFGAGFAEWLGTFEAGNTRMGPDC